MSTHLLEGLRVLDLTRVLSGPHCTRALADFGADVVKVEGPDGDPSRHWGTRIGSISSYFAQQNAGKRSLGLDLGNPAGRSLCRQLVRHADVIVENFRPGVMDRLGLGWDELSAVDPRLIYASITGYGRHRDRSSRKAYANMVSGQSGLLERQTASSIGRPAPLPFNAADSAAGLELFGGIMAALYHRERTGLGQRVEVSMLHTLFSIDDMVAVRLWNREQVLPDTGQVVRTSDGWAAISPPGRFLKSIANAMCRPDLLADIRFNRTEAADRHQRELLVEVERWSSTIPTAEVIRVLTELGVACEPIVDLADALDRELLEPDSAIEYTGDPTGINPVQVIATPIRLSATPPRAGNPPAWKGQHNDAVVRDWLADTVDIRDLAATVALLDETASVEPNLLQRPEI
ncbi:MAG: CoA transferase [Ilumatobacteraceae bacterium]